MILDKLDGKKLFTKFDIRWGYNNIRIHPKDIWKVAFKTPQGLFELRVIFFGMTNMLACFQHTMDQMFRRLKNKYPMELFVYMDDILIATAGDIKCHEQIIHEVLNLLEKESVFLKPHKCLFEQTQLEYLGVVVNGNIL